MQEKNNTQEYFQLDDQELKLISETMANKFPRLTIGIDGYTGCVDCWFQPDGENEIMIGDLAEEEKNGVLVELQNNGHENYRQNIYFVSGDTVEGKFEEIIEAVDRAYVVYVNQNNQGKCLAERIGFLFKVGDCIKHDGPLAVCDEIIDITVENGETYYYTENEQYINIKNQAMYTKCESKTKAERLWGQLVGIPETDFEEVASRDAMISHCGAVSINGKVRGALEHEDVGVYREDAGSRSNKVLGIHSFKEDKFYIDTKHTHK